MEHAIASAASSWVCRHFGLPLETYYAVIHSIIVGVFHGGIRYAIPLVVFALGWYTWNRREWFSRTTKEQMGYVELTIYDHVLTKTLCTYISENPDFFNRRCHHEAGSVEKEAYRLWGKEVKYAAVIRPKVDTPMPFNDTRFEVQGHIIWHQSKQTLPGDTKEIPVNVQYSTIYISRTCKKTPLDYIKDVEDWVEAKEKKYECYYDRVTKDVYEWDDEIKPVTIYSGSTTPSIEEAERTYIHTYFHQERDRLWSMIKDVATNPDAFKRQGQPARAGFLLYGPPGTGKSTFPYRVAMALGRHLISIDIGSMNRNQVYTSFLAPKIDDMCKLPVRPEWRKNRYASCVFVLEEFDLALLKLEERARRRKEAADAISARCYAALTNQTSDKVEHQKESDNHSEFTSHDLLDLFQGPVPLEGFICFATTNNLDVLLKICPALFRPGRLTPVHIDHLTYQPLVEMVKFHFPHDDHSWIPHFEGVVSLSTTSVIDLALEAKRQTTDQLEYFRTRMINAFPKA